MERSLALIPRSPRLERIYINFSDPWPKKRHWKRRVIQQETLRLVHRVMEEETVLYVVTDHPGYKEWIREQLDRASDLFQPVEEDWAVDAMDEFHESDYMMKGLARGYTISFFLARRVIPAGQKD
jgi:tRNA (guanine-N7-)-methyltransferase